jgi:hypothetical protein
MVMINYDVLAHKYVVFDSGGVCCSARGVSGSVSGVSVVSECNYL